MELIKIGTTTGHSCESDIELQLRTSSISSINLITSLDEGYPTFDSDDKKNNKLQINCKLSLNAIKPGLLIVTNVSKYQIKKSDAIISDSDLTKLVRGLYDELLVISQKIIPRYTSSPAILEIFSKYQKASDDIQEDLQSLSKFLLCAEKNL